MHTHCEKRTTFWKFWASAAIKVNSRLLVSVKAFTHSNRFEPEVSGKMVKEFLPLDIRTEDKPTTTRHRPNAVSGPRHELIVWVVVLHLTRHKIGHFRAFPQANLLIQKKTKLNTTKVCMHQSKEMYYNTKKLKPNLVAFYDIWPGKGEGLFLKEKISKGGNK